MINFQILQKICRYHRDSYRVDGHVSFCYFAGKDIISQNECNELNCPLVEDDTKWDKGMLLAYRALQKQIPKRPLQACGHTLERWMNYCPICGQRIDWEGEKG